MLNYVRFNYMYRNNWTKLVILNMQWISWKITTVSLSEVKILGMPVYKGLPITRFI